MALMVHHARFEKQYQKIVNRHFGLVSSDSKKNTAVVFPRLCVSNEKMIAADPCCCY
jgi:hypothetical protein